MLAVNKRFQFSRSSEPQALTENERKAIQM